MHTLADITHHTITKKDFNSKPTYGSRKLIPPPLPPLRVAAFTFCQQVTPQEYEDQREATTLESLKQLLCDISSSKTIPAKERRRLLKEFEKHHPVVFLQHLSSSF